MRFVLSFGMLIMLVAASGCQDAVVKTDESNLKVASPNCMSEAYQLRCYDKGDFYGRVGTDNGLYESAKSCEEASKSKCKQGPDCKCSGGLCSGCSSCELRNGFGKTCDANVNVENDPDNCGCCGNVCPKLDNFAGCVDRKCTYHETHCCEYWTAVRLGWQYCYLPKDQSCSDRCTSCRHRRWGSCGLSC
jgi:hypothetical protein